MSAGRPSPWAALRDKATAWLRVGDERAVSIAAVLIVAVGLWLRIRGISGSNIPLWSDEAAWAARLMEGRHAYAFRPIGFMEASRALVRLLGCSEFALRLLPWLAGLLSTVAALPLARALFGSSAARLLFIACIALNPAAIDLSKEFKPYSIALLTHETTLLFAVSYWNTRRARYLWLASGVAVLGVLFSQDALFAYPGVFLALGLCAWRGRNMRHLVWVAGSATLALGLVLTLYFLSWRYLGAGPSGGADQHWGRRYDVFFLGTGLGHRLAWLAHRYGDLAAFPGIRRAQWAEVHAAVGGIDYAVWVISHGVGLILMIVQRRLRDALLLLLPLVILIAFNVLGYWPLGAFRTNLFALIYSAAIIGIAFDTPHAERVRFLSFLPVAALVLLPLFAFERTWHKDKEATSFTAPSFLPQAVDALIELQGATYDGPPEWLVLDTSACAAWKYYTRIHPNHERLTSRTGGRFTDRCLAHAGRTLRLVRESLNQAPRVWVIYSDGRTFESLERELARLHLKVFASQLVGDGGGLVVGVTREPRRTRAQR